MTRKILSVLVKIVGALAVCCLTAAVRTEPLGPSTIALGIFTAILGTLFCIVGESDVWTGIRTAAIGFAVLCVLPPAPIHVFTWFGILICTTAASAAVISAGLLRHIHRSEASCS